MAQRDVYLMHGGANSDFQGQFPIRTCKNLPVVRKFPSDMFNDPIGVGSVDGVAGFSPYRDSHCRQDDNPSCGS